MVGVQDRPGRRHVVVVRGAHRPRQVEHGVQPGADPAGLGALLAGALQLVDLAQQRLADVVGHVRRLDASPVVVDAAGVVLAQLLADRGQLLAQQELALGGLHALPHVLGDLVVHLGLGGVVAGPRDQHPQPLGDVGRLQQLALPVVGEVRRVAGQVRQRGRVLDPADRVDDLPGLAPLQDRDHQPPVLLGELAHLVGDSLVLDRLGLDPQRGAGPGDAGPDGRPVAGLQHRGGAAAGEAADLLDGRDHAVRRVAVLQTRGDQHPPAVGPVSVTRGQLRRVDGGPGRLVQLDRHHHARQHDHVVQQHQRETHRIRHALSTAGPGRLDSATGTVFANG